MFGEDWTLRRLKNRLDDELNDRGHSITRPPKLCCENGFHDKYCILSKSHFEMGIIIAGFAEV